MDIVIQKPRPRSTTDGELRASFANDGYFRASYPTDPGTNYSRTLSEYFPTLQIDLKKSVPVYTIQINEVTYDSNIEQKNVKVIVGKSFLCSYIANTGKSRRKIKAKKRAV